MSNTAETDEPQPAVGTVLVLYPVLSVLVIGPACLLPGWYWLCVATSLTATVIVLRCFWLRAFATLPLLLWNLAELLLALILLLHDFRSNLTG